MRQLAGAVGESNRDFYQQRIRRVLRYIGEHLDEELSVERLSEVAGFSRYHFHRQFRSLTGISVGKLISLLRLKRASLSLAFEADQQIIQVAYAAGFSNPESFSRAFRKVQGQSPSEFRHAPRWERWTEVFGQPPTTQEIEMDVKIVDFPETRVAVLEHRGPVANLMHSVARFIEWRKGSADSPEASSATYGVAYDDPEKGTPDTFRFDICGEALHEVSPNHHGVIEKRIPGGKCAVVRHRGSTDAIGETVRMLYAEWLPDSGETCRDFPVFFHYVDRMPRVSEHDQNTDVYLPLV